MFYRKRLKYTDEQKSYIWDPYKQGEAVKAIASASDARQVQSAAYWL